MVLHFVIILDNISINFLGTTCYVFGVWRQKKTVVLVFNGTAIDILNSWAT